MAIIERITVKAAPIETQNRFEATWNVPTLGRYDFDVAANTQDVLANMSPDYVYLIDRVSISASIAEGTYLEAVDVQPEIRLIWSEGLAPVYSRPVPAVNYRDGLEWRYWFWTPKRNNRLQARVEGTLAQPAALVGVPAVYLNLSMVIYQENNEEQIQQVKRGTTRGFAGGFYKAG